MIVDKMTNDELSALPVGSTFWGISVKYSEVGSIGLSKNVKPFKVIKKEPNVLGNTFYAPSRLNEHVRGDFGCHMWAYNFYPSEEIAWQEYFRQMDCALRITRGKKAEYAQKIDEYCDRMKCEIERLIAERSNGGDVDAN